MISQLSRRALILALCSLAATAQAQDKKAAKADPAKGQQIASTICVACHGADGNSVISANPKLSAQHPDYLYRQLVDYAKPATAKDARVNPVMAGFAAGLTDEDRRNVAAWFGSQKASLGTAKNKDTLEAGQRIYRAGIPEKAVPACTGCHAPTGAGIPSQYPRLGGQHAEYTEVQLKAFRDGTRRNNVPMMQISHRMSDAEIKAVADYVAGLR
jgi:cytochrome c553